MKSLSSIGFLGVLLCSSCLELSVTDPPGSASSSGESSSSGNASSSSAGSSSGGSMGGAGGMGGTAGTGGTGGTGSSCDSNDMTLVACFPFDKDLNDYSGKQNPTTTMNTELVPGIVGSAAYFQSTGQVAILDTSAWTLPQVTVEAWFSQKSLPTATARMGLVDINGRMAVFVYAGGELRCTSSGASISLPGSIPLNTWIHVACVDTGPDLVFFVNGSIVGSSTKPPPSTTFDGASIGANAPTGDFFDGLIDEVRIWNVARSAADICKSAGKQGC